MTNFSITFVGKKERGKSGHVRVIKANFGDHQPFEGLCQYVVRRIGVTRTDILYIKGFSRRKMAEKIIKGNLFIVGLRG